MSEPTYGVTETALATDEVGQAVEEIERDGYTVLDTERSKDMLQEMRDRLDRIYAQQVEEIGGEECLAAINDANIIRCPLAYDRKFIDLAVHPKVILVAQRLLGEQFVLVMQNGVANPPGQTHYQSRWHRDLNYQHWTASRPIAIHALFCLDPFSAITGGTHMLPGSHLFERFPSE